jgi:hypothetical protein
MQIADQCVPWNISSGVENLILQALKIQKMGASHKFPGRAGISHKRHNQCFVEG